MKNDSDGRAKVPSEPHRIGRLVIFAEFERALIAEHAGQDSPPRAPALVPVVVRDRPPGEVSTDRKPRYLRPGAAHEHPTFKAVRRIAAAFVLGQAFGVAERRDALLIGQLQMVARPYRFGRATI